MISRTALLTMTALALTACGSPAPPQFGDASYRIEGLTTPPGGGEATQTVVYRNGPQMRVEATLPALGSAIIVFDEQNSGAYVLNPTTQAMTASAVAPAPPTSEAIEISGAAPAAPGGVAVRIENSVAPQPLEMSWASMGANNMQAGGSCRFAGERGRQWRPRDQADGVEREACITSDGIILQLTENDQVLWEATSLRRGPQDAALFGVPVGYRMIDPQTVASENESNVVAVPPAPN